MKFYLAIAFALLMATAYGIRNKQDVAGISDPTIDTVAGTTPDIPLDPVATPIDDTCDNTSGEHDNGNGMCTWTSTWCDDSVDMEGTSSSDYVETCADGKGAESHCDSSFGEEWSEGQCTNSGCWSWSDVCYECSNTYYDSWVSDDMSTWHNSNQCTNDDGSSDCKLAYFIILITSL
jgi:hypothetical protein